LGRLFIHKENKENEAIILIQETITYKMNETCDVSRTGSNVMKFKILKPKNWQKIEKNGIFCSNYSKLLYKFDQNLVFEKTPFLPKN
jgi:hypothetical protein